MCVLSSEIERAAKKLPDGCILSLNVERGAAWVTLTKAGVEIPLYNAGRHGSLEERIHSVVNAAITIRDFNYDKKPFCG